MWIHVDKEIIPCICKTALSLQAEKEKAAIYLVLVKTTRGITSSVPPTFLSSLCKPTLGMWIWRQSLNLQKVSKITEKGYNARTRMGCTEADPQCLRTVRSFVSWGGYWGVAGPSPAAGPTVISWWMSVQLFYYEREWIFPYVYSKICYYKFYVLYKYWFVCSF